MNRTKKLTLSAMLTALALVLSYMERFIPLQLAVPLPGVKLGLANVVTLFALYCLGGSTAAAVLLVRCVLGSLFGNGLTALAFSLTGGFLALGVMALARRSGVFSVFGVSVLGAAAHDLGQILAAMALLGSSYIVAYLPFLLLVSVPCGLLTGAVTAGVLRLLPGSLTGGRKPS